MSRPILPPTPPTPGLTQRLAEAQAHGSTRLIYEVELLTPMFGGGTTKGEPDMDMPFRSRSIKGHLRWWWRHLAVAGAFDPYPSDAGPRPFAQMPLGERREAEARLWGMLDSNRPKRSRVLVMVRRGTSAPCSPFPCERETAPDKWVEDVGIAGSGYALFPAQHQRKKRDAQHKPPLLLVPAGERFTLEVLIDDQADLKAVKATVLAWATFGGIGARTRRGAGAVAVRSMGQLLSALPAMIAGASADKLGLDVQRRGRFVGPGAARQAFDSPRDAWIAAVARLREFRQGAALGRNGLRGRSRWPEPDGVRELAGTRFWLPGHAPVHRGRGHFPRAAFGLPLTIRFVGNAAAVSQGNADQVDHEPLPRELLPPDEQADRMASPLILRPVAVQVGGQVRFWAVAAVIEQHPFRSLTTVRLRPQVKPAVPASTQPVWDSSWRTGVMGGCADITALERPTTARSPYPSPANAVEAFMNFFAEP